MAAAIVVCCWCGCCCVALPTPTATLLTLVAGKLSIALASSASSLSNTGLPRPLGQPLTTHVTTPPQLSPLVRTSLMTGGGGARQQQNRNHKHHHHRNKTNKSANRDVSQPHIRKCRWCTETNIGSCNEQQHLPYDASAADDHSVCVKAVTG